jgi:hypothetical protein
MYADDTTLHCHSNRKSDIERNLNEDLNTVNKWCIQNNMLINPTKTTCMLIGTAYHVKFYKPKHVYYMRFYHKS